MRFALDTSVLSLALLTAAAVAFTRQRRLVLAACGVLFVATATAATVAAYWPLFPVLGVAVLCVGMGLPLLGLALYGLDRTLACFTVEMTYATTLCWVFWPLLVLADFAALLCA